MLISLLGGDHNTQSQQQIALEQRSFSLSSSTQVRCQHCKPAIMSYKTMPVEILGINLRKPSTSSIYIHRYAMPSWTWTDGRRDGAVDVKNQNLHGTVPKMCRICGQKSTLSRPGWGFDEIREKLQLLEFAFEPENARKGFSKHVATGMPEILWNSEVNTEKPFCWKLRDDVWKLFIRLLAVVNNTNNKSGQDLQLTLTHTHWDQCEFASLLADWFHHLDMIVSYCNIGCCTALLASSGFGIGIFMFYIHTWQIGMLTPNWPTCSGWVEGH